LPNPNHKWRLATNASNVRYLAKSMRRVRSTLWRITHASSHPRKQDWNWNWELRCRPPCADYLRGVHFELITDSKVVAAIIKKDVPTRRQNLLVRLFEFDFTVTHRKGEL